MSAHWNNSMQKSAHASCSRRNQIEIKKILEIILFFSKTVYYYFVSDGFVDRPPLSICFALLREKHFHWADITHHRHTHHTSLRKMKITNWIKWHTKEIFKWKNFKCDVLKWLWYLSVRTGCEYYKDQPFMILLCKGNGANENLFQMYLYIHICAVRSNLCFWCFCSG